MNDAELKDFAQRGRIEENEFYRMIVAMYERIWQNLLPPQLPTKGLTTRLDRNVVTPGDAPVPDCVTCGACCASMLAVGVRPGEEDRIEADAVWDITSGDEGDPRVVDRFLRRDPETFYCAQLQVCDGRTTCRIYESRPRMCRDFDAGSDKCHALRRAYGFEPFLGLAEMSEANRTLGEGSRERDIAERVAEVRFQTQETGSVAIVARMLDGSSREIHRFDPSQTVFRQFEFDALTIEEAKALIAARESP
jgi:Fe-S-cluster containining protein